MKLSAYQSAIETFAKYPMTAATQYCLLGLTGEAGEIANKVKKILRDDHSFLTENRRTDLIFEAGDVLWYLARLATHNGYALPDKELASHGAIDLYDATLKLVKYCADFADFNGYMINHYVDDVLIALTDLAQILGVSIEEIAQLNIDKLTDRLARDQIGGAGDNR